MEGARAGSRRERRWKRGTPSASQHGGGRRRKAAPATGARTVSPSVAITAPAACRPISPVSRTICGSGARRTDESGMDRAPVDRPRMHAPASAAAAACRRSPRGRPRECAACGPPGRSRRPAAHCPPRPLAPGRAAGRGGGWGAKPRAREPAGGPAGPAPAYAMHSGQFDNMLQGAQEAPRRPSRTPPCVWRGKSAPASDELLDAAWVGDGRWQSCRLPDSEADGAKRRGGLSSGAPVATAASASRPCACCSNPSVHHPLPGSLPGVSSHPALPIGRSTLGCSSAGAPDPRWRRGRRIPVIEAVKWRTGALPPLVGVASSARRLARLPAALQRTRVVPQSVWHAAGPRRAAGAARRAAACHPPPPAACCCRAAPPPTRLLVCAPPLRADAPGS